MSAFLCAGHGLMWHPIDRVMKCPCLLCFARNAGQGHVRHNNSSCKQPIQCTNKQCCLADSQLHVGCCPATSMLIRLLRHASQVTPPPSTSSVLNSARANRREGARRGRLAYSSFGSCILLAGMVLLAEQQCVCLTACCVVHQAAFKLCGSACMSAAESGVPLPFFR